MVIRARRCLLLAAAILACGPEDSNTTAGEATDTQPTSTGTDDSGRPPADCVPDQPTDPDAITCAKRGEADCDGPLDERTQCKWITTAIHDPNATTCEPARPGATCVALRYYGDGCGVTDCGDHNVAGHVYFRTKASCEIEASVDLFCGDDIVDWSTCTAQSDAPPPSPPDPVACQCAC